MATNYIQFDEGSHGGRQLRNGLTLLEQGLAQLNGVLGMMVQAQDNGAVGTTIQGLFGFPDVATAQAGYSELSADVGKLNTNADVTNVNAALIQLFNKFR